MRTNNMQHYMAVGSTTRQAYEEIRSIGGTIRQVSEFPFIFLVSLPNIAFEMVNETTMRITAQGDDGKQIKILWMARTIPQLADVSKTMLQCENDHSFHNE